MKKKEIIDETYLCPRIEVVSMLSTQVLCASDGLQDFHNDEEDIDFN